jgi:hypothetical protein
MMMSDINLTDTIIRNQLNILSSFSEAAKHNDPATLQFVLTRKNVYDIENSLDLVQHSFLRHIFRYNADLVLQSLIQHYSLESNGAKIAILLPLLAEYTIYPFYQLGSNITFNATKTFELVLRLHDSQISRLIAILPSSPASFEWTHVIPSYNRVFDDIETLCAIFYCKKYYPQHFSFDINKPIEHNNVKFTPLEIAAGLCNRKLFDLFLENGAVIDNANYCYINRAYDCGSWPKVSHFAQYMIDRGVDIKAKIAGESMLNRSVHHLSTAEYYIVEDLLCKGAKLLPEEEISLMNLGTDSDQYKLARCSLEVTPYSLKDRIVRLRHLQLTKILLDNTRYQRLTFKPQKGPNIVFHVDGKVEVFGDPARSGTWKIENDILRVHVDKTVKYAAYNSSVGSYGHDYYSTQIEALDLQFLIVKLFNNKFALLPREEYSSYYAIEVSALYIPDLDDIDKDFDL